MNLGQLRDAAASTPRVAGPQRRSVPPALTAVADVSVGALVPTVVGRPLAAPMRRGEPLTDVRLLGTSRPAALGGDGPVTVPVRVTDGKPVAVLVHAGDVVDVLGAAHAQAGTRPATSPVATAVRGLAGSVRDVASGEPGGLVGVAATPEQASALAGASSVCRPSLALCRP